MEHLTTILTYLVQGGAPAIITILFVVIAILVYDRKNLHKQNLETINLVYAAKDKEIASIKEIIDKYYRGNIDLVNALNEIKTVLVTMQSTKR